MNYSFYYSPSAEKAFSAAQLTVNFGINLQTIDIVTLNARGFYPVTSVATKPDTQLYTITATYTIVGSYAEQGWTSVPLPLATAKITGTQQVQVAANQQVAQVVLFSGYSAEVLSAAGAALEVDRPAIYQTVIAAEQVVTDQLALDVAAIAAATTVDEINNIVNPPTGVIHIGRTGQDFDPSYYVSFNSTSLTEADTELYIPGTSTVVTYGAYVPGEFDTPPGSFALGNYLIQIREVATSSVIAEFECPSGYEDISF